MKASFLTIATYNVKRFEMADSSSIVRVLSEHDIDVCGMQEVPGKKALEDLLHGSGFACLYLGPYWTYGNAFVYRVDRVRVVPQTSKMHILKDGQGKKAAHEAEFEDIATGRRMKLCVTHLDHRTEPQRLSEWNRLQQLMSPDVNVLLGDFNALRQSDYTADELQAIIETRKTNNWEAPQFSLTNAIEACGFEDALHRFTPHPTPTSRFATRVDYIWIRNVICEAATVIESPANQSDHKPVCVQITL